MGQINSAYSRPWVMPMARLATEAIKAIFQAITVATPSFSLKSRVRSKRGMK